MQSAEVKACLLQMQTLWTSYKAPQTEQELQLVVGTWLQFFGQASFTEVSKTINEIASEGGEFAPQIGQIYSKLKANRALRLTGNGMTDEKGILKMKAYREALSEYYHSFGLPTYWEYIRDHPNEPKHTVAWRTWDRMCAEAGASSTPSLCNANL